MTVIGKTWKVRYSDSDWEDLECLLEIVTVIGTTWKVRDSDWEDLEG